MGKFDHLADRWVDLQAIFPRGRLFYEIADASDHVAGSYAILNDVSERLPHLLQIRRVTARPAQRRPGVGDRGSEGAVHLKGGRRPALTHWRHAVFPRPVHFHLPISAL